jgi:hypothetical protein
MAECRGGVDPHRWVESEDLRSRLAMLDELEM